MSDQASIGPETRVTFGRKPDKGRKVKDCSTSFLRWMVRELANSDLCGYAQAAQKVLEGRVGDEQTQATEEDLEAAADSLLKEHGFGYLARKRRRRTNAGHR